MQLSIRHLWPLSRNYLFDLPVRPQARSGKLKSTETYRGLSISEGSHAEGWVRINQIAVQANAKNTSTADRTTLAAGLTPATSFLEHLLITYCLNAFTIL